MRRGYTFNVPQKKSNQPTPLLAHHLQDAWLTSN